MADVFISYDRADEKYAEKIANILKGWDFTVWWDRSILPGEDFRKKIKGQLETAKCAVVLWSISASESGWVCDEAGMAKDRGIYVPACLDEPINVPLGFRVEQYADLQDWQMNPSHPGITNLLKAIEESVKRHTPSPPPLSTEQNTLPVHNAFRPYLHNFYNCKSIGVHVGTTRIKAALIKITGNISLNYSTNNIVSINHDAKTDFDGIKEKVINAIDRVLEQEETTQEQINAIGIVFPGQVNRETGTLWCAPNLLREEVNFCTPLRQRYGVNVQADNDINCAAFAELMLGYGDRYRDFVCVYIGTGIGAGIVVNSKIVRGYGYAGGEIGHTRINYHPDARECTCGGRGCFEEYASARGIIRKARVKIFDVIDNKIDSNFKNLDPRTINPGDIVNLIEQNDKEAKELATDIAEYIAIGIANIANILNPQAIILGGGMIERFYPFNFFAERIKEKFTDSTLKAFHNTELRCTELPQCVNARMAPVLGAALLPFEQIQ